MTHMLELVNRTKTFFINIFKGVVEKVGCIIEQMGNFSRELEVLQREYF